MRIRSVARRAYDLVALFALLNVAVLGAIGAYLVGTGGLNRDKAERIAEVLRDGGAQEPDTSEPAQLASVIDGEEAVSGGESEVDREIARREGDRIKAELAQRLDTIEAEMTRVSVAREAWLREVREEKEKEKKAEIVERHEGFKKQIEYFESLAPKIAVEHLLAMPDPDDAARLLAAMDARRGKKIVEAAKKGPPLLKMQEILRRMTKVAPDRTPNLEGAKAGD